MALLKEFKDLEGLKQASTEDIKKLGISESVALEIKKVLGENNEV